MTYDLIYILLASLNRMSNSRTLSMLNLDDFKSFQFKVWNCALKFLKGDLFSQFRKCLLTLSGEFSQKIMRRPRASVQDHKVVDW